MMATDVTVCRAHFLGTHSCEHRSMLEGEREGNEDSITDFSTFDDNLVWREERVIL